MESVYKVISKKNLMKFIIVIFVLCFASFVVAETYYVSNTGSDSNIGNKDNPFQTIQKGVNVASGGDIVIVKTGVYTSSSTAVLTIYKSGNENEYITLKSEEPRGARFDGKNYETLYGILLMDTAAYIIIDGFDISYFKTKGIYGTGNTKKGIGSHDIIIKNNEIHHIGQLEIADCADAYGRAGFGGHPLIYNYHFESNTVHDIGRLATSCQEHAFRHDHGLYLQGKNIVVRKNLFYNHLAGWAIKVDGYWGELVAGENSHTIADNTFRPNVRIDENGGGYIRFYNNKSYSDEFGYMKPPVVLIEGNQFFEPVGPGTDSAVVISDYEQSNFEGTVIKNNVTTSSHLYSENISDNIVKNVISSGNILNFSPSKLSSPTSLKITQ